MRKKRIIMAGVVTATVVVAPGGAAQAADGESWRVIRPVITQKDRVFQDVEAVSAQEVWIAGFQENYGLSPDRPILQRWNGTYWRAYQPEDLEVGSELYDLSAVGPNDTWVVGNHEVEDDTPDFDEVYLGHWDGNAWNKVDAPPANRADSRWHKVAADEGGVWLAEGSGRVSRWDGTSWTTHFDLGKSVYALESFSPDEAWLRTGEALHRWDGASWSQVALPAGAELSWAEMNETDGVWVPTPTGLAVWKNGSWQETPFPDGYQNRTPVERSPGYWVQLKGTSERNWLQWTGSDWVITSDPGESGPTRQMVTDAAGRIWGIRGTSVRSSTSPPWYLKFSGKLVHYENGEWKTTSLLLPWSNYMLRAVPGTDKTIGVGVDGITGDLKAIIND